VCGAAHVAPSWYMRGEAHSLNLNAVGAERVSDWSPQEGVSAHTKVLLPSRCSHFPSKVPPHAYCSPLCPLCAHCVGVQPRARVRVPGLSWRVVLHHWQCCTALALSWMPCSHFGSVFSRTCCIASHRALFQHSTCGCCRPSSSRSARRGNI
jgi:hypothetical protein